MTTAKTQWTLDQYHRMVDAGVLEDEQVELLRGEIVLMSPEGIPHANKRIKAGSRLQTLLGDRAQVRPAAPITLMDGSEPEPDLAIAQMPEERYDQHHPYPEDLYWVVEYSNASLEKDLGIKAEIYAAANIPEYWIINLRTGVLIVLRNPVDGQYRDRQEFTQGTISPLAFPDLLIPVEMLLQ